MEQFGAGGPALIIRRGPCVYDSRILREADTLRKVGYRPLILGVVSEEVRETHDEQAGTPIIRLEPSSPFAWARSRQRRLTRRAPAGAGGRAVAPSEEPRNPLMRAAIRIHRWLRTLDFYRRAIAVVGEVRPALIHCNDYNTMWVGVAARLMGGITVVYDSHELWPDRNGGREPRWWLIACEFLFVHARPSDDHGEPRLRRGDGAALPDLASQRDPQHPRRPMLLAAPRTGLAVRRARRGAGRRICGGAYHRSRAELSIMALAHLDGVRLRLVGPAHARVPEPSSSGWPAPRGSQTVSSSPGPCRRPS